MRRYGLSLPAVALMAAVVIPGFLLSDATDDRSLSAIAIAGMIAIVDSYLQLRGRSTSPGSAEGAERPRGARSGIVVGLVFVVVGVLAAAGVIEMR